MARAAQKKPPSRVRYEEGHPTVSCRVARAVYDRLRAANVSQGRSFADILKIGLGILEVQMKEQGEIRKKAFTEGRERGYAEARQRYQVCYPCNVCRRAVTVTSTTEQEAIGKYMQRAGWGHRECHDRRH